MTYRYVHVHLNKLPSEASAGGFIPFLRMLHAKQGTIVTSNLPYENTISVADSEIMKSTLQVGDRPIGLFKFLEPLFGDDQFQIYDAERDSKFKKVIRPAFGHEVLMAKYEDMRSVGIDVIKRLEESLNSQDNVIIKLQEQCLEYSLRVTSKALISSDTSQDFDFKKFKQSYDAALSGLFDNQFGILNDEREKDFQQSLDSFVTALDKLINDRKNMNIEPTAVKDFLDILLTENDPDTGRPFSDEKIRNHVNGYLTAGYHTSGVAIPFTLLALTQNPEVKARLQEEIDEVLQNRLPTLEDLSKMDYLTQVIKETLRVYPVATFCARLIKTETTFPKAVENFKAQADTTIIYCIPLYHENPSYFPNPKKFDPSRFSRENSVSAASPGERFAMIDIKIMVCLLVQKFDFELAMKLEDVQMEERFVVMAKNDILIKFKPRRGINA
ncbi:2966_t:CDS:2 [Cetraspora pellucida]|uniref:2966_t:CDS:1 n=1 Tax=Cetraspora pellucida TaxID=1433469 RepID=A0A9N9ARF3_9GLOM|nr:2966_t:CDS:2 [Cetraspora pellucida]